MPSTLAGSTSGRGFTAGYAALAMQAVASGTVIRAIESCDSPDRNGGSSPDPTRAILRRPRQIAVPPDAGEYGTGETGTTWAGRWLHLRSRNPPVAIGCRIVGRQVTGLSPVADREAISPSRLCQTPVARRSPKSLVPTVIAESWVRIWFPADVLAPEPNTAPLRRPG